MGKGRKAVPDAVKVLRGTDQRCRMRDDVKFTLLDKVPKAPEWMCQEGKKVYKVVAGELLAKGMLDVVSIHAVAMYANEMGKYVEAERTLSKEGRVVEETDAKGNKRKVRNVLDKAAGEYLMNAKSWAAELGVTPASSGKVKTPVKDTGKDDLLALLEA